MNDLSLTSFFDNNQGLGFGNYNPNPSQSERRKYVIIKAAAISEESHITHALSLKQQSVWLQWSETVFPFDFSWHNLIWGSKHTCFQICSCRVSELGTHPWPHEALGIQEKLFLLPLWCTKLHSASYSLEL